MDLAERLTEVERRVAALEQARPATDEVDEQWAVTRLREDDGGIVLAGAGQLPTGETYEWQAQFTVADAMAEDLAEAAECLAVLGDPVRLRLLREIITGRRTAAELAGVDGLGSSAEIYHHLRALAAVGWLHTAGLGRFEVPAQRLVPLLAAVASTRR
ncbi:winged helix-turn-helix transcriptional regulator [Nocardia cyriacigeorgica]|uniref:Winged helix-turn-helix transcriptional regulator n=1 Tax=Nocardia cyriacigeorgica TaxID=135487 RepID=A0A6P1D191_9NOCA|nr:winged helix-turn-helix domain-containing protein [Nocardia cyriacigeorgica]NEW40999.1 winged helix-turn-helix transcriptional regulator [Nocardia cyriacigeorgica]NEW44265.1 winged helix-turn-helix transcriptional regulator [Nocardia cyriacigeorgica]NEW51196.1 winged helix-turn-helix transcriptional regulator [Nocardia cyriacigeorgica]NEW55267.1 winged helix-turn-helix transcriptional regulator [Nocardia cyriacigeorgica]